jgi:PAT family beta-lactamase induction signal transducer AmpG
MMANWRSALTVYADRRVLAVLFLGFSSGLPFVLTAGTLSAWLATGKVSLPSIGLFALVGLPYSFKYLWSPLIDRLPPPLPLGRRRGWAITIQLALLLAILGLGLGNPAGDLGIMAVLAVVVAFLSASQDIVVDAYRIELLEDWQQGAGAGAAQTGYQIGMMASGAGALYIAQDFGWFAAYAVMAGLLMVGILVFLLNGEPETRVSPQTIDRERRAAEFLDQRPHLRGRRAKLLAWFYGAWVCPFADFMARPGWVAILLLIIGYKMGEAMAGRMANPLYVSLGYTLKEIGTVSKVFGVFATLAGGLIGGVLVARLGTLRALLLCGILQSVGNLAYVLQVWVGHDVPYLALCVFSENLTGGMAGAAMVAYLSSLCNLAYTATHYALLSSVASMGRTLFASSAGWLVQSVGWIHFFLATTVMTVPALLLLVWMMWRGRSAVVPVVDG